MVDCRDSVDAHANRNALIGSSTSYSKLRCRRCHVRYEDGKEISALTPRPSLPTFPETDEVRWAVSLPTESSSIGKRLFIDCSPDISHGVESR